MPKTSDPSSPLVFKIVRFAIHRHPSCAHASRLSINADLAPTPLFCAIDIKDACGTFEGKFINPKLKSRTLIIIDY